MAEITIKNLDGKTISTPERTRMLDALTGSGLDWMHACGGNGRCTTCAMVMVEGADNLSPLSPAEKNFRTEGKLPENERLACQCVAKGDVVISVPERSKLPHVTYS